MFSYIPGKKQNNYNGEGKINSRESISIVSWIESASACNEGEKLTWWEPRNSIRSRLLRSCETWVDKLSVVWSSEAQPRSDAMAISNQVENSRLSSHRVNNVEILKMWSTSEWFFLSSNKHFFDGNRNEDRTETTTAYSTKNQQEWFVQFSKMQSRKTRNECKLLFYHAPKELKPLLLVSLVVVLLKAEKPQTIRCFMQKKMCAEFFLSIFRLAIEAENIAY